MLKVLFTLIVFCVSCKTDNKNNVTKNLDNSQTDYDFSNYEKLELKNFFTRNIGLKLF